MISKEKPQDIHERIYKFVVDVLSFIKTLPKTPQNLIITNQILRSVTSMGANDQEADGTDSRKDFISKYCIVRKEGKETNYWLRLIEDTNKITNGFKLNYLKQEGKEIVKIVSSIILKTKGN